MVAISTDSPHWFDTPQPRSTPRLVAVQPAGGGAAQRPQAQLRQVLLVIAAVVVVLAVAVGTAAFGRLLDSQRGIPSSAVAVTAQP